MLIAESYYTVFLKQATRFYIGDDAIVSRKLAEDPTFWDFEKTIDELFVEAL